MRSKIAEENRRARFTRFAAMIPEERVGLAMRLGQQGIASYLEALGARHALIGAHAVAARLYPRFTVDIDVLTTDARVLDRSVWARIEGTGGPVDVPRGDDEDPLRGVVHLRPDDGSDIDVVVGRWAWEGRVVERAEPMRIAGREIPVARTSDLILLKLAAAGYGDLQDAAMLPGMSDREHLVRDVEEHIGEVHPDIRPRWRGVLAST